MRILITNDDGIYSRGLKALEKIAKEIAGPKGEIWVVAPAFEQSGVAHCISYIKPITISQIDKRRWATEGSPADCVIAAVHNIMKDSPPDLILSGVNRGNNSAENALYSGTLGAAMEGSLQGFKSIALSQYYGPEIIDSSDPFEAARHHAPKVIQFILNTEIGKLGTYRTFFNVNFPPVAGRNVKGMRIVPQGMRSDRQFHIETLKSIGNKSILWVAGSNQQIPSEPETDAALNLMGYISITPMTADLTDYQFLHALEVN
ncbi:MAG: 5'/3'-nucleotidase SurE [Aestuariivita sp.]|nr:5'/3'-nucleotidase SurE [Aestuariivita sp.]